MTSLTLHSVKKLFIGDVQNHVNNEEDLDYKCMDLYIVNDKGETVHVAMFLEDDYEIENASDERLIHIVAKYAKGVHDEYYNG